MKVGIISGRYPATEYASALNHKIYADRFGYTYIHCNWATTARNVYLNKIHYLLAYIDLFDYLIWIDDDAFFFDFDTDIMQYIPGDDKFLAICKSPSYKELKTYVSSGQFILKCNNRSKSFLKKVLSVNLRKVKSWWTEDLGYFTNGDQDAVVYLLKTDPDLKDSYDLLDYKTFNSRVENLFDEDKHRPLILHFTGKPDEKWANYLKVQKQFQLHSSLVSDEFLKNYSIVKKQRSFLDKVFKKLFK